MVGCENPSLVLYIYYYYYYYYYYTHTLRAREGINNKMGESGCRAHAVPDAGVRARWRGVTRIVERAAAHYDGADVETERRCQWEAVDACQCCGGPALRALACSVCSR